MSDDEQPIKRRVIHATCALHPGTPGFTNLELIWDGEDLTLHPHATGVCKLILSQDEAAELHTFIGEVLGGGTA